jgi:hypothetical protein
VNEELGSLTKGLGRKAMLRLGVVVSARLTWAIGSFESLRYDCMKF